MADYVVDTTIVMTYLTASHYTPNASAFFDQVTATDQLFAPEFCLAECTNVFWKEVRFGNMPFESAQSALTDLHKMPLTTVLIKPILDQALDVGLRRQLSVYDSLFIVLAQKYQCPLLTLDEKQTTAALAEHIRVIPITNFAP
jgi:predicted nucleic acid-binding protein